MERKSMLFNVIHYELATYLIVEAFQVLFPTTSLIFAAAKLCCQVIQEKNKAMKLHIHNGGWHEILNYFMY